MEGVSDQAPEVASWKKPVQLVVDQRQRQEDWFLPAESPKSPGAIGSRLSARSGESSDYRENALCERKPNPVDTPLFRLW
jgi:hypothetical protein